jgi:SHS2 domain-containing protein
VYRWREHTGELELELEADTPEGLFEEALAALAELLSDGPGDDAAEVSRDIDVTARDRAALLVEWIDELALRAELDALVPQRAERLALSGGSLHATVRFRAGSPPHLVKAATYHRLTFERHGSRWHATVVLDV